MRKARSRRLRAIRRDVSDPKIKEHQGRIVKTTGDGLLIEFASVVDAVRCAVEVQRAMAERNAETSRPTGGSSSASASTRATSSSRSDDIFGDGVNVAARLEGLAEPGGICVSRVVRDEVRDKLDFAFDDMGEQQVKNIARPLRVFALTADGAARRNARAEPARTARPSKPSLAVLPFQNMTGDPEQEYFADGMVEEITTAIVPPALAVRDRAQFQLHLQGQTVDVKQVARELGVRYVLEGSVRKAGNRVRITGQLIDTATSAHIWADRFDGALDDIFDSAGPGGERASSAQSSRSYASPRSSGQRASRLREPRRLRSLLARSCAAPQILPRRHSRRPSPCSKGHSQSIPLMRPRVRCSGSAAPCRQGSAVIRVSEAEIAEALDLTRRAIEGSKDDPDVLWMAGDALSILCANTAQRQFSSSVPCT